MTDFSPNQASTAPAWTGSVRNLFLVALSLSLVMIVVFSAAALPLAVGSALLAYLLYPLKRFLQQRVTRGRAGPAVATVVLLVLGAGVVLALSILPAIVLQSINFFESTLPAVNRFFTEPLVFNGEPVLGNDGEPIVISERILAVTNEVFSGDPFANADGEDSQNPNASVDSITGQILQVLGGVTLNVVNLSFRIFGLITALVLNTLFLMMLLSYFLSDGEKMIDSFISAAPAGFEADLRRLFWELGRVWNDYLRGQLILSSSIAFIMWGLTSSLGLQSPLFLGVFAGLMEFIPNIGPTLSIIPPILVAIISGSSRFPEMSVFLLVGILLAVWTLIQQVQGLVIVPRVIGSSLNLHPVLIVLGVVIGGSLGGIIGIVLAGPTLATLRIMLQYVYGRLADKPPFRNNPQYDVWLTERSRDPG